MWTKPNTNSRVSAWDSDHSSSRPTHYTVQLYNQGKSFQIHAKILQTVKWREIQTFAQRLMFPSLDLPYNYNRNSGKLSYGFRNGLRLLENNKF